MGTGWDQCDWGYLNRVSCIYWEETTKVWKDSINPVTTMYFTSILILMVTFYVNSSALESTSPAVVEQHVSRHCDRARTNKWWNLSTDKLEPLGSHQNIPIFIFLQFRLDFILLCIMRWWSSLTLEGLVLDLTFICAHLVGNPEDEIRKMFNYRVFLMSHTITEYI